MRFLDPPYNPLSRFSQPKPYALELRERLFAASNGRLWSIPEWSPLTQEERRPYSGPARRAAMIYSPRADLAVGPFADDSNRGAEFDWMLLQHRDLVERLLYAHHKNSQDLPEYYFSPDFESLQTTNANPRCFMAIEIERGNRNMKYLLGTIQVAAALGKIGIIVCWDFPRRRSVMGIHALLSLLGEYGKNTIRTGNLLVLGSDQIMEILNVPSVQGGQ